MIRIAITGAAYRRHLLDVARGRASHGRSIIGWPMIEAAVLDRLLTPSGRWAIDLAEGET
jgi:hypothetical protein